MKVFNIDSIFFKNDEIYSIQGKVIDNKTICINKLSILSLIITDAFDKKIEIIAFNEAAEYLIKKNIKQNSIYYFQRLKVKKNLQFKRTSHDCKLVFENANSKIVRIDCLEYKINDKIFVKSKKDLKNDKPQNFKHKQLSIKSFFSK